MTTETTIPLEYVKLWEEEREKIGQLWYYNEMGNKFQVLVQDIQFRDGGFGFDLKIIEVIVGKIGGKVGDEFKVWYNAKHSAYAGWSLRNGKY